MNAVAANIKARQEAEALVDLAGEQPPRFWETLRDTRPTWNCAARQRVQSDMFGTEQRPREAKIRWIRRLTQSVAVK